MSTFFAILFTLAYYGLYLAGIIFVFVLIGTVVTKLLEKIGMK